MLDTLTNGFRDVRLKFQGQQRINEEDIKEAVRAIRVSLLEADVDYQVANGFLERVSEKALGEIVQVKAKTKSRDAMKVTPGDTSCVSVTTSLWASWVRWTSSLSTPTRVRQL